MRRNASSQGSRLKYTYIASLVASLLASGASYATEQITGSVSAANNVVAFNNNDFPSDLTGSLAASVSFAQSQIMPSKHGVEGDVQPYLIAQRVSAKPLSTEESLVLIPWLAALPCPPLIVSHFTHLIPPRTFSVTSSQKSFFQPILIPSLKSGTL